MWPHNYNAQQHYSSYHYGLRRTGDFENANILLRGCENYISKYRVCIISAESAVRSSQQFAESVIRSSSQSAKCSNVTSTRNKIQPAYGQQFFVYTQQYIYGIYRRIYEESKIINKSIFFSECCGAVYGIGTPFTVQ